MGPVKAASYVMMHGLPGAGLGIAWAARWPWGVSIAAVTAARSAGMVGYLSLTSWMLNENLVALLVGNVHSLLVRDTDPGLSCSTPTSSGVRASGCYRHQQLHTP